MTPTTITPDQKSALWLIREYGRARIRSGFRRMLWYVEGSELFIAGPSTFTKTLVRRGFVEAEGDAFVLTASGLSAAQRGPMSTATRRRERSASPDFLIDAQIERVARWFPRSHGVARLDDRLILSGIVHVLRHNLQWAEAPECYGGELRLRRRFTQWGRSGVLDRVFADLVNEDQDGRLLLVVSGEMLARHSSGRFGAMQGWFPTLLAPEEIAA